MNSSLAGRRHNEAACGAGLPCTWGGFILSNMAKKRETWMSHWTSLLSCLTISWWGGVRHYPTFSTVLMMTTTNTFPILPNNGPFWVLSLALVFQDNWQNAQAFRHFLLIRNRAIVVGIPCCRWQNYLWRAPHSPGSKYLDPKVSKSGASGRLSRTRTKNLFDNGLDSCWWWKYSYILVCRKE